MKSQTIINLEKQSAQITPMREFLHQRGKEANFTSAVSHITLEDSSEWVLKLLEKEPNFKELTEIIAEVAAYEISKAINLDLVPKTKMVTHEQKLGSLQKFVDNTLSKAEYNNLLSVQNKDIECLKLFWFILGQWDTSIDNVLFTQEQKPIAIDNANIANIQQVSAYGKHHFVRLFYTDQENQGSIETPITIHGKGPYVSETLSVNFGTEIPKYFINTLCKKNIASFTYFIEHNRVWRNFNDDVVEPDYFMHKFSQENLQKFQFTNSKNIFSKLITRCAEFSTSDQLGELNKHFNQVAEGIEHRYHLAENYLNNLPKENNDNPAISGEFEDFENINEL